MAVQHCPLAVISTQAKFKVTDAKLLIEVERLCNENYFYLGQFIFRYLISIKNLSHTVHFSLATKPKDLHRWYEKN